VLQCVAVWSSTLLCVAVCCSVLLCVAVCCSVLQCLAVSCSVLQYAAGWNAAMYTLCAAVCRSMLQCVAVCCSVSQCVAVCCSVSQCVAVCCSVLQRQLRVCCIRVVRALIRNLSTVKSFKRGLYICQQRLPTKVYIWAKIDLYSYENRPKRDLSWYQKSPTENCLYKSPTENFLKQTEPHWELFIQRKRLAYISKETYISVRDHILKQTNRNVRKDLYLCQTRPICMPKETYMYAKRDLYICKRPHVKRDQLACPKTPCVKRDPKET